MKERAGDKKISQQNHFPIYSLVFLFSMLISLGGKIPSEEQIREQSNDIMPAALVIHNFSCKGNKGQYSNSRDNTAPKCMHVLFSVCEVLNRKLFSDHLENQKVIIHKATGLGEPHCCDIAIAWLMS